MQTATSNRTLPEVMIGNFTNVDARSITTGFPVCFTTTAASVNGNNAVLPAAAQFLTFAGVSRSDVAANGVGTYIGYGWAGSVRIFATGSSVTNAAGIALGTNAASLGVNSTGALDTYGPVLSMESIGAATNSPGGWARGFVRAL